LRHRFSQKKLALSRGRLQIMAAAIYHEWKDTDVVLLATF
jgi:hypothetical protein